MEQSKEQYPDEKVIYLIIQKPFLPSFHSPREIHSQKPSPSFITFLSEIVEWMERSWNWTLNASAL